MAEVKSRVTIENARDYRVTVYQDDRGRWIAHATFPADNEDSYSRDSIGYDFDTFYFEKYMGKCRTAGPYRRRYKAIQELTARHAHWVGAMIEKQADKQFKAVGSITL